MRRKAPALAALLTALALTVSACGGSPKDGVPAGGTGGQQGQPVKGGTLTVARIEDTLPQGLAILHGATLALVGA